MRGAGWGAALQEARAHMKKNEGVEANDGGGAALHEARAHE